VLGRIDQRQAPAQGTVAALEQRETGNIGAMCTGDMFFDDREAAVGTRRIGILRRRLFPGGLRRATRQYDQVSNQQGIPDFGVNRALRSEKIKSRLPPDGI
jgi:hypothetical protein